MLLLSYYKELETIFFN